MEENKDVVLDEKTRNMVIVLKKQMAEASQKIDLILQTIINTKYPDSNDLYELSEDCNMLIKVEKQ